MRLEDKLAYRLLNESNHRVLNQYELYFLIENLFNDTSDKRLNEVDWRYWGGRVKGFGHDVFDSWNSGGKTQPKRVNLPKETSPYDDSIGDLLRVGKNRFWDRGIKHYWKNFKWSSDSVRNGRLRADHLLRKVMNGEKLDPTEITDINLIIGVADTNDPNNNGKRGSGSFAHRDVRTAFEGNPDLQQAMRRRFKDAGYTAISNSEEDAEKTAAKERRTRRQTARKADRDADAELIRARRDYMTGEYTNLGTFNKGIRDQIVELLPKLDKELNAANIELNNLLSDKAKAEKALSNTTDKESKTKAQKLLKSINRKIDGKNTNIEKLKGLQYNARNEVIKLGSPKSPSQASKRSARDQGRLKRSLNRKTK